MSAAEFASWLGETTLAASVLIAVVLVIRKPIARRFGAEAAYLLWLAPITRFALPELKILPRPEMRDTPIFVDLAPGAEILTAGPSAIDPFLVGLCIWSAGALAFLLWQGVRQRQFIDVLRRNSSVAAPETAALAAEVARAFGVRRLPDVRMAADRTGPLVAGVLRPIIILPSDFDAAYSHAERRLALSHECAHIARGDLLATAAALIFRAAQWPNPLVHAAFGAFRSDQEAACDASVIARNEATPDISYLYGAAILKSAASRAAAPAASLAMSHHLKERLMLMKSGVRSGTAFSRAAAALVVASALAATASYASAAEKDSKEEVRIVKKQTTASSVSVISVDGDEELELEGVKNAGKIEVRNEDGARTVKIWDRSGKLVSEKTYGPGEDMPHRTIIVVGADGKKKTVKIGAEPDHPEWIEALGDDDLPGERKIVVMKHGDHELGGDDIDCEPIEVDADSEDADGERRVTKNIICIKGADGKDPKARAEALRKAIEHMEKSAAREAEHREKMLAKLRAELAAAEKEAAKK